MQHFYLNFNLFLRRVPVAHKHISVLTVKKTYRILTELRNCS